MSGPSNLFINAYMYAVNKAAYKVMGKAGIMISRLATDDLLHFLREKSVLGDKPSLEDVEKLFTEDLAIAEKLEIEEDDYGMRITLRGLRVSDFLRKIQEERFEPVACPLAGVILRVCEMHAGCRLTLRGFDILDPTTVSFRCSKVKQA